MPFDELAKLSDARQVNYTATMRDCCQWLKKEAQTGEKQMTAGIMAGNFKYDTLMLNVTLIFGESGRNNRNG